MITFKFKPFAFAVLSMVFGFAVFFTACEQENLLPSPIEEFPVEERASQEQNDAKESADRAAGFALNYYGDSHIYWPFANSSFVNGSSGTNGWVVTCGPSCGWHHKSDYYADDWARYGGTCGQDFKAPISGTIIFANYVSWGYGNQVIIQSSTNGNFAFRVAHLQSLNVSKGQWVSAGTVIGKVGTTGNSTGCHAHAVLYKNIYSKYNGSSWMTGKWRLDRGYGLGSGTSGYANQYAAPYYFDAGNRSATSGKNSRIVTKQDDLDGVPNCSHPHSGDEGHDHPHEHPVLKK